MSSEPFSIREGYQQLATLEGVMPAGEGVEGSEEIMQILQDETEANGVSEEVAKTKDIALSAEARMRISMLLYSGQSAVIDQ